MTPERREQILRQLRSVTSAEELTGFRAELRRNGEAQDTEIFRAMERAADTFRGKK
jgi:hypothetical protein